MAALSLEDVLAAVETLRRETQTQLAALRSELDTLKGQRAGASAAKPEAAGSDEVSPETLVMMAAVVTAYLGKKVRVRSAKMLQTPYEIINPWAQHGRVIVHASQNLQRGR